MSDYRLEFGSMLEPSDTDRLYDLLSIVSEGDKLEITMDSSDSSQIDTIVDVLQGNDFSIINTSVDGGKKYRIVAKRTE